MPPRVQWIEHQGRPILYSNYAGLKEEEYLQAMDETLRELLRQPAGSTVLTVTDVSQGIQPGLTLLEGELDIGLGHGVNHLNISYLIQRGAQHGRGCLQVLQRLAESLAQV